MYCWPAPVVPEMTERQKGFFAPNLSPVGLELIPTELAKGVYGLMANRLPKDNNGLIIGSKAALVVDAGITPGVGKYLQEVVKKITDKPVRYLANTTFHGDHTFGNVAFPDDVAIVSSRLNKASMTDLEKEKELRGESMYGDPGMEEVVTWREPDIVFDRFCEIDLGGRVVHLWHFGTGNGSGDTLVHVPDARVVWAGNFLRHAGMPPMLLAGDPIGYSRSIRAMKATLELDRFVPGHGPLSDAEPSVSWMLSYLENMAASVDRYRSEGMDLDTMMDTIELKDPLTLPSEIPGADRFPALMDSLHRLNVLLAYRYLAATGR
ncbi:MBL fold metallo-hydrolase [Nonomuraea phyllanthi]|uniref:MBL fold metallo-hydrolase n=2 Tax=Nonomuraea phyllanthi TaxID=2219224 RepID=A0A5C4VIY8_9ACTN|nr:MBL fold metallo-hydrolase [Nonomuraea phyllanthi]QFY10223.1 MBL fold metallo-hydrolase [Nonomuraea phyllanthi]